jgi:hypothetical protein
MSGTAARPLVVSYGVIITRFAFALKKEVLRFLDKFLGKMEYVL